MKQTMKRALALLMALLLAIPTLAFSEESQQLEVVPADGGNGQQEAGDASQPDGFAFSEESRQLELVLVDDGNGGLQEVGNASQPDDAEVEIPLEAPEDAPQTDAPQTGAPAVDLNAEVTYCFIVDDQEYASQTAREGDVILPPDAPEAPEGMAFDGWFLEDGTPLFCDADGDGRIDEVIAHPDGFTTLVNVDAAFVKAEQGETTAPVPADAEPAFPEGEGSETPADDNGNPETQNPSENEEGFDTPTDDTETPAAQPSPDEEGAVTEEAVAGEETNAAEDAAPSDDTETPAFQPSPDEEGGAAQGAVTEETVGGEETNAAEDAAPTDDTETPAAQPSPDEEGGVTEETVAGDETNAAEDAAPADDTETPAAQPSPEEEGGAAQGAVTEEAVAGDETNAAEDAAPSDPGETPEISSAPVSVIFTLDPENAALTVYPLSPVAASIGETQDQAQDQPRDVSDLPTPAPIPAQADGSYALMPGEYAYSAEAEGCVCVSDIPFTVVESDEALLLSVVLEPAPQADTPAEPVAFEQSRTVNGVIVTVKAEPGAFPEDATLSVARVPVRRRRKVESAVDEAREDDQNVVVSYTFDIKVLGADGGELQPAEGFGVGVSFALEQAADENLEANVYHVTQDGNGELTADKLDEVNVDAAEQTVTAQTDGFSIYTVEFTYNAMQYVLEGGESVSLSAVLDTVGLVGEVEAASVSDEALFSVSNASGAWLLETHQPFITEEWLRVTVNGVEYEITVTDAGAVQVAYCAMGATHTVVAAVVGADTTTLRESSGKWYVVNEDITLKDRLVVLGNVNLILVDGKTLDAPQGIRLAEGNGLSVYGSSGSATGKLNATAKDIGHAGIGGNLYESGGDFTLYGGEVKAQGNTNGAGLGGGDSGSSGVVSIYGGRLSAKGGELGAGIGGGISGSQGGAVTVWNGMVEATGGDYAAGIGGGCNYNDQFGNDDIGGNGSYVTVWGGTVVARGGKRAAGIGGGQFGNGGTVRIGGTCDITAVAGSKSKNDKYGIQAIGRGQHSTKSDEGRVGGPQVDGTVVFPDDVQVKAGDKEKSAKLVTDAGYLKACRKPYVHITSSENLTNTINATINQLHKDRVTDTIDVRNMQGNNVNKAAAGEQFQVVVTLEDGKLKEIVGTYTAGGATQSLRWDSETKSQDGKVITYVYTMPMGVSGTVEISAEVEAVKHAVTLPNPQPVYGTVQAVVGGKTYTDTCAAMKGEKVKLLTAAKQEYPDYYVQKIVVTGDNSKVVHAKLENDTMTKITKGDTDNEWTFEMPGEPVTVSVTFQKGCHYINLKGDREVRRDATMLSSQDNLTLGGGISGGWYAVSGTVNIQKRINVTSEVNLILCDGATLNAKQGIFVPGRAGGSLTIWAQNAGTGKLVATATDTKWAGIGGNEGTSEMSGKITINGGDITAQGGSGASGIGGGKNCQNDTITINVPKGKSCRYTTVHATGGKYGPGIGGGQNTNNQLTVINNGFVIATGGAYGAGIGGGEGGGNEKIVINGGYVEGHGGYCAAGMGGGQEWRGGGMGGTVEIHGGTVGAYGGHNATGIGPGEHTGGQRRMRLGHRRR